MLNTSIKKKKIPVQRAFFSFKINDLLKKIVKIKKQFLIKIRLILSFSIALVLNFLYNRN